MAELLHAARVADISSLSLPPSVAAQLQQLVSQPGPLAAARTAGPLLAALGHDLPALLALLRAQHVRPSAAWADAALRAWLGGDAAASAARAHARDAFDAFGTYGAYGAYDGLDPKPAPGGEGPGAQPDPADELAEATAAAAVSSMSVLDVRAIMEALEALFPTPGPARDTDGGPAADEPALPLSMSPPSAPPPASPSAAAAAALLYPPSRDALLSAFPSLAATAVDAVDASGDEMVPADPPSPLQPLPAAAAPPPTTLPYSDGAACLRYWLDACLTSLLDGGGLARSHQREDLFGMLPYLRTAPSAAVVERLYCEAWPPYPTGAWAASPEATAGLLCVCAASGAQLPLGARQRELSALEQMILLLAPPGSLPSGLGPMGYQRPPAKPLGGGAGGAGGGVPAGEPLFPHSSSSASSPAAAHAAGPRRLSAHAAFLALSAFHHHITHAPAASARSASPSSPSSSASSSSLFGPAAAASKPAQSALGGVLLSALLSEPGRLGPAARCRCVRALLHCLPAALPRLLLLLLTAPGAAAAAAAAASERGQPQQQGAQGQQQQARSPLLDGWEALPAAELLAVLDDAAAAARSAAAGAAVPAEERRLAALGLLHLSAHVVQLPGWPQRLAGVNGGGGGNGNGNGDGDVDNCNGAGLTALTRSLRSLLDVLTAAAGLRPPRLQSCGWSAPQDGTEHLRLEGDAGGGGGGGEGDEGGVPWAAAQEVLAGWLDAVLPAIEEGVRAATQDWGRPPPAATPRYSAAPTAPMPLSAAALAAALAALSDAAAALDQRHAGRHHHPHHQRHQKQHRVLVWALQRLGSRAARCELATADFPSVPELLLQMESVSWVDRPLEWAHAVVRHGAGAGPEGDPTDPRDANPAAAAAAAHVPAWFRSLPWQDAIRVATAAGQLVRHARDEVLRSGGALVEDFEQHDGGGAAAAAPPQLSRPRALLAAAQSLQRHVVGLLAARAAAAGAAELRDAAVAWQAYSVPYDRAAMGAMLAALAAAPALGSGGAAGGGSVFAGRWRHERALGGPAGDAAQRLRSVCEAQQAPSDDVSELFAVF